MKKQINKVMAVGLASTVVFSGMLTACNKGSKNTSDHLEIKMYEAGNGTESIQLVANRFMELNPGKTVEIRLNTTPNIVESEILNGPSINTIDLYLASGSFFSVSDRGSVSFEGVTYDNHFESLKDVYENPATGETIAIKDKMYKDYANFYYDTVETPYYAPWVGGWCGLVYNAKMFETYGWDVPLTTDQLFEVCDEILATKTVSTNKNSLGQEISITPFTFSREDSYWGNVYMEWQIQYDGMETYENFMQGKNANGEYNPDLVASQGILESMKVMETILGTCNKNGGNVTPREKVYTDNTLTFRTYTDSQSTFLYGEEARRNATGATTAAMMPNGDWLENEMRTNFADRIESDKVAFRAMKTPIISAIANKTSFKDAADKDLKLRELVAWIDNNKQGEKPAFASDSDVAIVENARNVVTPQSASVMVIPAYSTSKELAKDFIRFLYSDEGCKIFMGVTKGIELPMTCDYTGIEMSEFQKSKFEIVGRPNVKMVMKTKKYPIMYKGGITYYKGSYGSMESRFSVSNPNDYMTAEEMLTLNYSATKNNWAQILENAGIN